MELSVSKFLLIEDPAVSAIASLSLLTEGSVRWRRKKNGLLLLDEFLDVNASVVQEELAGDKVSWCPKEH